MWQTRLLAEVCRHNIWRLRVFLLLTTYRLQFQPRHATCPAVQQPVKAKSSPDINVTPSGKSRYPFGF